jgi:hypothetical protein
VTSEYSSSNEEEEESDGGRTLPERWEPLLLSPRAGGGRGDSAWGGRGSARRQAAYKRGDARCGGTGTRRWDEWGCGGGHASGGYNVRRAPEEEETRILHPEVGDRSPIAASFRWARAEFSRLRVRRVAPTVPPRSCQGAEVGRDRPY